jgi:alpha-ketoglutarate-dependent taurine dioxygenase
MTDFELKQPNRQPDKMMSLKQAKRKPIHLTATELVNASPIQPGQPFPLVLQPTIEGVNLVTWASHQRSWLQTQLWQQGGILFRGFQVNGIAEFEQFIQAISGELLNYSYRSTPRSLVSGHIYTSTEYPATQSIPLHNEMSYARSWPLKIWFYCCQPAEQGGATPIADSRNILARLDAAITANFQRKGVMYVRNYGAHIDLPWQTVFQTTDPSEVERYCCKAGIEFEWLGNDRLRTRQVCQAIATHPRIGEAVWFNQAHLFHLSGLPLDVQQSLLITFDQENLPRHTYYGDGSPIESIVLDQVREAYCQETVTFEWQAGDILMLDNMLVAHGRQPYTGARRVVVGMADPYCNPDL